MITLHKVQRMVEQLSWEELRQLDRYLHELLQEIEAVRGQEMPVKQDTEILDERKLGSRTYRLQRIKCGKTSCKCASGERHGPYWYAFWWENGSTRTKYIGKNLNER